MPGKTCTFILSKNKLQIISCREIRAAKLQFFWQDFLSYD